MLRLSLRYRICKLMQLSESGEKGSQWSYLYHCFGTVGGSTSLSKT